MIQILQSRSKGQLDGFKKKKQNTYLYAKYKRLALDLKTQAENEGIKIESPCKYNEKKTWIAILL